METYKLLVNDMVKSSSGTQFDPQSDNKEAIKYRDWIVQGNTPDPADVPPAPTYTELRASAYAPLGEQLDMQYKDKLNGTTTWQYHITAIKTQYPKV